MPKFLTAEWIKQVKGWIESCCGGREHKHCQPRHTGWVPTRLIDVRPRDLSENQVRLIQTQGSHTLDDPGYAALSYC